MSKVVRIHPYDPQRGHLKRRYMAFDQLFREDRGWYRDVPDYVAEYLATVRNIESDPASSFVFQICDTVEDARKVVEAEEARKRVVERAAPEEAHSVKVKLPSTVDPRFEESLAEAAEREAQLTEAQRARQQRIADQEAALLERQQQTGGTLTTADLLGEPEAPAVARQAPAGRVSKPRAAVKGGK